MCLLEDGLERWNDEQIWLNAINTILEYDTIDKWRNNEIPINRVLPRGFNDLLFDRCF